jgi:hypothetical protein
MPRVHEVKMGNHSDAASYELTDISDIVGTIRGVCINLAINLLVGWRSSA